MYFLSFPGLGHQEQSVVQSMHYLPSNPPKLDFSWVQILSERLYVHWAISEGGLLGLEHSTPLPVMRHAPS